MATHCTSWHWYGPSVSGAPGYWGCTGVSPGADNAGAGGTPTYTRDEEDPGSSDDGSGWDAGEPSSGGGGPSYNRRSQDYGPEDGSSAGPLAGIAPWLLGAAVIALGIAYFYEGP